MNRGLKLDNYMQLLNNVFKVNYEILKTNHGGSSCKKYSSHFRGSLDDFKIKEQKRMLKTKLNCSVPFHLDSDKDTPPFCRGEAAKEATKILTMSLKNVLTPCTSMAVQFGIPNKSRTENRDSGSVTIYLTNVVKVTQDLVSYDLLR